MANPGKNLREKLRRELIVWLARRLPACRDITPMFSESLDRKLSVKEKIVMKLHLFTCDACKRYVKQLHFLRDAFRIQTDIAVESAAPLNESAPRLSFEARERMKAALKSSINE